MELGVVRIRHVKVPVTDLAHSVRWYRALLGLELVAEFVEQGELRGAQLVAPDGSVAVALRDRRHCGSQPDLAGFDPFAFEVDSVDALHRIATHCESLGVAHSGVQDRGQYGASLDVPDPDGAVLRFLANNIFNPGRFFGIEFGSDGTPTLYDTPRLN